MTPRQKQRMWVVGLVVAGVAVAVTFTVKAFQQNMLFFLSPSQVLAGELPGDRAFRLGGMVIDGSVLREPGSLEVKFSLTDNAETVQVAYSGLLPDLFREGQGIIARGRMNGEGVFVADEVLAKHDEEYMPPEIADTLKKVHNKDDAGGNSYGGGE